MTNMFKYDKTKDNDNEKKNAQSYNRDGQP